MRILKDVHGGPKLVDKVDGFLEKQDALCRMYKILLSKQKIKFNKSLDLNELFTMVRK